MSKKFICMHKKMQFFPNMCDLQLVKSADVELTDVEG